MPSLFATIGGTAAPLRNELHSVERAAGRAAQSLKDVGGGPGGHGGGKAGVVSELLVVMREIGRGNFTRVPGSVTILAQRMGLLKYAIKDTALAAETYADAMELASRRSTALAIIMVARNGEQLSRPMVAAANAAQLAAMNARKVAEAERELAGASTFALGPIGWTAIAIAAVATGLFFLWRHFKNVREEAQHFADLTDLTRHSLEEEARTLEDSVKTHQAQIDWLKKHGAAEEDLKQAVDDTIKAMKEKAKFEHELAAAKGASHLKLAKMDLQALREEQSVTAFEANEAEKRHHKTFLEQGEAAGSLDRFNIRGGDKDKLALARKQMLQSAKVADAIRERLEDKENPVFVTDFFKPLKPGEVRPIARRATEADKITVTVDNIKYTRSLAETRDAMQKNAADVIMLAAKEKEINDLLREKTKLTEEQYNQYLKLKREAKSLTEQLKLQEQFSAKIAEAEDLKSIHPLPISDWQKHGGFIMGLGGETSLIDVNRQQLSVLEDIRAAVRARAGLPSVESNRTMF